MFINDDVRNHVTSSVGVDRRVRLYFRQKGRCFWCNRSMNLGKPWTKPRSATEDHLLARAYGGRSTMDNLVGACLRCNSLRYELSSLFFRHMISVFGNRLPERGTPEFASLQRAVRHSLDGKRIRVRIPIQTRRIVCEEVQDSDKPSLFSGRKRDEGS